MTINAYEIDTDELQSFEEGEWVQYGDSEDQVGVIVGVLEDGVDWPTGDDETEEVDPDGSVYIVGRRTGGSKPFSSDELESIDRDDVVGNEEEMPDEPEEDLDDAEMALVYEAVDDPFDVEELLNVPGVDDPGVGWDSYPDSWEESEKPNRLILLDAWSSMEGTFTGCVAETGSRRLCASMKDEVLGTERWRNRF